MTDQQKKYEEAAKFFINNLSYDYSCSPKLYLTKGFIAGAEHASKEAHNEAIDKAIGFINHTVRAYDGAYADYIIEELEKLKL